MYPSDLARLRRGLTSTSRWLALVHMARTFVPPVGALRRYVDSSYGSYPWTTGLRTPAGTVPIRLPGAHDVRTVNEIFCRHDYGSGAPRVVVDIGANIGVSAVYFLTRRPDSVVYAYEPVPSNLEHLRHNTAAFPDRVRLDTRAVSPTGGGTATFYVEAVGRYSGLADFYEHDLDHEEVLVETVHVADVVAAVLESEGHIDLLKIDTEGSEDALVRAIPAHHWARIGEVRYEHAGNVLDRPPVEVAPSWSPRTGGSRTLDAPE